MKKTLLAVMMATLTGTAVANETVRIVWPFGPVAATQYMRVIATQATEDNKNTAYIMDFKTGGGGTIAVTDVANNKNSSLLAHTNAFWTNPALADTPTYNVNDWKILDYLCDLPLVLVSKKYKTWQEIPRDKPVSIGYTGTGSTTHLTTQLITKTLPNLNEVGYKTAAQAATDLLGGHVDLLVTLPGDIMPQVDAGSANVLGASGPTQFKNHPTLTSLGVKQADKIQGSYFFFVNKGTDAKLTDTWTQQLRAAKTVEAKKVMENAYCRPSTVPASQYDQVFAQSRDFWNQQAQSLKANKK